MPQSGLSSLKRAMQAYFDSISVDATVLVGLRHRENWNLTRVVLIPGKFDGSPTPRPMAGGKVLAPTQAASLNPGELQSWEREITLSIFAVDVANKDDPEAQNAALENMLEQTIQACWSGIDPQAPPGTKPAGMAGITWGDTIVIKPQAQNACGDEILLQFSHKTPLFERSRGFMVPSFTLDEQMLDSETSGRAASISSVASGLASIVGLGGFASPTWVGGTITLSGAGFTANNGTFPIAGLTSSSAIVISNAAAVAPDANNGRIVWSVTPQPTSPGV